MNINAITLAGYTTADVELRQTGSGISVATFNLAVSRPQSKEAREKGEQGKSDFIKCRVWRGTAEYLARTAGKGSGVLVTGALHIDSFDGKDGQKRYDTVVECDGVQVYAAKTPANGQGQQTAPQQYAPQQGGYQQQYAPQQYAPQQGGYQQPQQQYAPQQPQQGQYAPQQGGYQQQYAPQQPQQGQYAPQQGGYQQPQQQYAPGPGVPGPQYAAPDDGGFTPIPDGDLPF